MIKTLTYSININETDIEIIKSLQNDYSYSFRKMYNNMDLVIDKSFLSELKIKSKKQIEYLNKEVIAFYKRNQANKERISDNIDELLNKDKLTKKDFKRLKSLEKSLKSNVVFGDKKELIKLSKSNGNKLRWKESRLLPLVFYGEKSRKGNRFFDLKGLDNGNIIFKLEGTNI
jgi:galactokinase/mevalonate kinase-like predicted kinase